MKVRLGSISFLNSLPVDYALKQIISDFGFRIADCGLKRITPTPQSRIPNSDPRPPNPEINCGLEESNEEGPLPALKLVKGPPTQLNRMLISGQLDISPISSIEYARWQDKLLILPELSISSDSGVNSVILVSRVPIEDLESKTIYVTDKGATTPVLLKILLAYHYGVKVNMEGPPPVEGPLPVEGPSQIEEGKSDIFQLCSEKDAVLLIGDEALKIANQVGGPLPAGGPLPTGGPLPAGGPRIGGYFPSVLQGCPPPVEGPLPANDGLFKTDLSAAWHQFSGHKMVFALWVVREEFANQHPHLVAATHQALLASKQWGLKNIGQIVTYASSISAFSPEILNTYFQNLRYDFDENYQAGLQKYYEYARKIGVLDREVTFRMVE